jgi:beta-D-xylosidase 4
MPDGDMVLCLGSYDLGVDVHGSVTWEFSLVGEEANFDSWPAAPGIWKFRELNEC